MKTLDQILSTPRPSVANGWKDRPMVSSYAPVRGMAAADFDGIGDENTFIPFDRRGCPVCGKPGIYVFPCEDCSL